MNIPCSNILPKKQRVHCGFTLLETLVSVAIIAVVSAVLSQVFISTLRTNTKTEILKEVKQNGDLALETITRMIQNAQSITCVTDQSLALVNPDGDTTTLGCSAAGSTLRLASVSASTTAYITSESVTLGNSVCSASTLQFTCQESVGVSTGVTVFFELTKSGSYGNQFETASESFQTSAVMRSSSE